MNKEKCCEWTKERQSSEPKNPLTKKKIKKNGLKYQELDKECQSFVNLEQVCQKWLKTNHENVKLPYDDTITSNLAKLSLKSTNLEEYYTVTFRTQQKVEIKDYLETITIPDGKVCMTENKSLLKFVAKPKLLGYGSFGNVYGVTIPKTNPTISIAIKEARINDSEMQKAKDKQYPMEYLYNKLINDLVDEMVCPNFSYTFAIFFCNACTLNDPYFEFNKKTYRAQCSETVVERFDFTLDKLKDLRDEVVLSILFQILYAISSIQLKYGMFHNDIKTENVLIKTITSGGYWVYTIYGEKYFVPNYGYIAILNDFGVSQVFKPGFSKGDYGLRQAEVVKIENNYIFRPFTTKFYPNITIKGNPPPAVENEEQSVNHFYKNFDSEPSITVDLNDMGRFPPYFFHYDVMDVILMVVGGPKTLQPGDHRKMKVSKRINSILSKFYVIDSPLEWPTDRVDLFLANRTIAKIFDFYGSSEQLSQPKIEEYSLY